MYLNMLGSLCQWINIFGESLLKTSLWMRLSLSRNVALLLAPRAALIYTDKAIASCL